MIIKMAQSGEGGIGIKRVDRENDIEKSLKGYPDMPIIQEVIEGEDLELTIPLH